MAPMSDLEEFMNSLNDGQSHTMQNIPLLIPKAVEYASFEFVTEACIRSHDFNVTPPPDLSTRGIPSGRCLSLGARVCDIRAKIS